MKAFLAFLTLTLASAASAVAAQKMVFAHHVAGVAADLTPDNWVSDMKLAKEFYIDGFALNIGNNDPNNDKIINNAFDAADKVGFKIFFSFDYATHGAFPPATVIDLINRYKGRPSYYLLDGRPYVSTFEGPGSANDWISIKGATNCYFVPDWSSLGPEGIKAHLDKIDGAFNWNAWPDGPNSLHTDGDDLWRNALGGKHYLMGVSPWFYTNLPQWNKNWLWRGDNLWHYRWEDIIKFQPSMVEIITWNDFGESHYIGPLYEKSFPQGAGYCKDMPHQAWLKTLPNYIARYKGIDVPKGNDKVVFWYRPTYGKACASGATTGNNIAYQKGFQPFEVQQEKVYVTVILDAAAEVAVQIGSAPEKVYKSDKAGLFHFDSEKGGAMGPVNIIVRRDGKEIKKVTGTALTNDCPLGHVNWNAWVGEDL
ncbi:hypothetical protein Poli38472_012500 [Pythium oligandrum]|uniref:Uncharacterized protein n=1 Tax=Pythium oligandrum TaxID=41045 RepID=A0A8K1CQH5_PYTOL|nr:hypothetical protein Poli38472_012500 [Pythium oligandrum]|eukprot:TMW67384.1 hypothetical protein Poli38472_012500 [Pythium oligandrum]